MENEYPGAGGYYAGGAYIGSHTNGTSEKLYGFSYANGNAYTDGISLNVSSCSFRDDVSAA